MNDILNQTERVSDIFTKIMLKIMSSDLSVGASEEITTAQVQAMRHIAQHGPCTIGSLAEGLSVSQPAATMLVDRMTKRDLVSRQPGKSDRRQAELSLTDHGRAVLEQVEAERMEHLSGVLALMSPEERDIFLHSLEQFISAALKYEHVAYEACLRCGSDHSPDCIVNQMHLELSGKNVEKT